MVGNVNFSILKFLWHKIFVKEVLLMGMGE